MRAIYAGGGIWNILDSDELLVGTLRQGFDQAWTARALDGTRLTINGFAEWGGNQGVVHIAREFVTWPSE